MTTQANSLKPRSVMPLTAAEIAKYSAIEKHLHDEIHRTFNSRNSGKKVLYQAWSKACDAWHSYSSPLDKYWEPTFKSLVQSGNRQSIDELITYLEVDPYYFRSGYLKGRLIRIIKRAQRTEQDNRRLRGIMWNRTCGQSRQEFREYCRLATLISTPSFRADVARKTDTPGNNKFELLLSYLPETPQSDNPLNQSQKTSAKLRASV